MLLSIIIVNYNSGTLLLDCLQSAELDLFDLDKVEWIIVDNSNNTGDKKLIEILESTCRSMKRHIDEEAKKETQA